MLEKDAQGNDVEKLVLSSEQLDSALAKIKDLPQAAQVIKIASQGTAANAKFELPADQMVSAVSQAPNATILFETKTASYAVRLISIDQLKQQLGADSKDIKIQVLIQKPSAEASSRMNRALASGNTKLLGEPLDFSIVAQAGDKQQEINNFPAYVERSIHLPSDVDVSKASAVTFDPNTNVMSFVPAVVTTANGVNVVTIKRNSNSIYAVIANEKSFADMQSHWAQNDVNLLASKLIIQGISDSAYAPQSDVTRGQFAALLTRALGLKQDAAAAAYADVKADNMFKGAIGAAVKAGLAQGYEDGSFQPDRSITRQEMAVMINRALDFTGVPVQKTHPETVFADETAVSSWAQQAIRETVKSGIINGVDEKNFAPAKTATRAETAVMLKRMLEALHFINS